jgi:hypothetical protein
MNPDMAIVEPYAAGRRDAERKREAQQLQSRRAQPRRKDNRRSHRGKR